VHTSDQGGGAERVALDLHRRFLERGHRSWLLVGRRVGHDPGVLEIPTPQRRWPGHARLLKWGETYLGLQYLQASGRGPSESMFPEKPDVVLLHSLHGADGYFDLEILPRLTSRYQTYIYLHDQWLLTGHCAYALDCGRWRSGCGRCPDLHRYPSIATDGTRWNWLRKRRVLRKSRLKVGAPSQWLLDCVAASPLLHGTERFYIVNGVDTNVFRPIDRREARALIDLPADDPVVLFVANRGVAATYKDFRTLAEAFLLLKRTSAGVRLVAVGADPTQEVRDSLPPDVLFRPHVRDQRVLAAYYSAADIFCHSTRADVCPLTVLEAQACGTPVAASAAGGVPEIVRHGETGWLFPCGDAGALARLLESALGNRSELQRMGTAARAHAVTRFDEHIQADAFLSMFHEDLHLRREHGIAEQSVPPL
jgi:glycosyltransferase involved in cell wall biosynthesis